MVERVPPSPAGCSARSRAWKACIEILDAAPARRTMPRVAEQLPVGARILRIAVDYAELEARRRHATRVALGAMRSRGSTTRGCWTCSAEVIGVGPGRRSTRSPLAELRVGMTLADDVRSVRDELLRRARAARHRAADRAPAKPGRRRRPRAAAGVRAPERTVGADGTPAHACGHRPSKRILFVDDDEYLLEGLRDALRPYRRHLGHELRVRRRGGARGARARAGRRGRSPTCGWPGWTARRCWNWSASAARARFGSCSPVMPTSRCVARAAVAAHRLLAKPCETEELASDRAIVRAPGAGDPGRARPPADRRLGAAVGPPPVRAS